MEIQKLMNNYLFFSLPFSVAWQNPLTGGRLSPHRHFGVSENNLTQLVLSNAAQSFCVLHSLGAVNYNKKLIN